MTLRTIRVPRLVGVFRGRADHQPELAHSQVMGGMIWGLSQALLEDTVYDHRLDRIVNASFGDYLIPVNADVQRIEAEFIPEDDPYVNPLGVKGVGEIGRPALRRPSPTRSTTRRASASANSQSR